MAVIESLLHALVWWLALTAITATGWLLVARNTRQFEDRGWAVAKQLTVIALAFVVWIAGHAAPLFQPAVVRSLVFGVIVLALIARRKSVRLDRSSLREILSSEARFGAAPRLKLVQLIHLVAFIPLVHLIGERLGAALGFVEFEFIKCFATCRHGLAPSYDWIALGRAKRR